MRDVWTREEVRLLKRLYAQGVPLVDITKRFPGRTQNAVGGKAERLGLRHGGRPRYKDHQAPTGNDAAFLEALKRHHGNTAHRNALKHDDGFVRW